MRKVFFLGVMAVLGLLFMFDSITGFAARSLPSWAGPITVKGGLSDLNDKPLLGSKTGYYWQTSDDSVRVISGYFSDIVAVNKDGRVYGSSIHEDIRYEMVLNDDWYLQDKLDIKVGYYNDNRPGQSRLYFCASIDVQDILSNPVARNSRVYRKDLACNITVLPRR